MALITLFFPVLIYFLMKEEADLERNFFFFFKWQYSLAYIAAMNHDLLLTITSQEQLFLPQ